MGDWLGMVKLYGVRPVDIRVVTLDIDKRIIDLEGHGMICVGFQSRGRIGACSNLSVKGRLQLNADPERHALSASVPSYRDGSMCR